MSAAPSPATIEAYHCEVVQALEAIGNPALGSAIQQDRESDMAHLGIRFPVLRKRVKQGFSFYSLPPDEVLAIWDALWRTSPYGDVLFAALEYYGPLVRNRKASDLWPTVSQWVVRVDNWCHSDMLSNIYSWLLEEGRDEVLPRLKEWNYSEALWLRRASLVSLVHYSGKNAVFLPVGDMLPLVTNCLADERRYIQTAVGWVLREMGHVYEPETTAFLESNVAAIGTTAFTRAIERRSSDERACLREMRKAALARGG